MGTIGIELGGPERFGPGARQPAVWFDPAYGVTLAGVLGISQWIDKASGFVMLPGTGSSSFAVRTNDPLLGNRRSIYLNNVNYQSNPNYWLASAALSLGPQIPQPITVYAAVVIPASLPIAWLVFRSPSTSGTVYLGIDATTLTMGASAPQITAPAPPAGAHVLAAVFNGADSALYVDSSLAPVATGAVGASQGLISNVRIGPISLGIQGMTIALPNADTPDQVAQMFSFLGDFYSQPWS